VVDKENTILTLELSSCEFRVTTDYLITEPCGKVTSRQLKCHLEKQNLKNSFVNLNNRIT